MNSRLRLLLSTSLRLGPGAVGRVAFYRLGCKTGLYRHLLPQESWSRGGEFFAPKPSAPPSLTAAHRQAVLDRAGSLLNGDLIFFSSFTVNAGAPPDWFVDPFGGSRWSPEGHWSQCGEFSASDIKNVWEPSRFEWAPVLALAWRLDGKREFLDALNGWLLDWARKNPVNGGPNWKCGQEASIRAVNLLLAARILAVESDPCPDLIQLVAVHCRRIAPTLHYAIGQDNNHGISEAAALFIAGGWLAEHAGSLQLKARAGRWHELGRRWLENRVAVLVAEDGSFSQYSLNYHRVVLDTLCQAEIWRRELGAAPFSDLCLERCRAATSWLHAMTDPETGDAPNLGANDGARLYDITAAPYRDFRPSVQLASMLFQQGRAYPSREWDGAIRCLGIDPDLPLASDGDAPREFGDGGYVVLHGDDSRGFLRYASFRFRPGHSDCLHLDLWHRGVNILRDGGTYSYNTDPRLIEYFSGTGSHNTVQFDDRSQMPRLGRFLFGEWLGMEHCSGIVSEGEGIAWSGAYRDWMKARHARTVSVRGKLWRIRDEIGGFREKAVLRWRLAPADWRLEEGSCESGYARLRLVTSAPVRRLELVTGFESLHYGQMTELPILELEVGPGDWTIETEIILKD